MRDFFAHFSNHSQYTRKALDYFVSLFPDAHNEIRNVNGITIIYSADSIDVSDKISLYCPIRKANLFISGKYDIPEHLGKSTNEKTNNEFRIVELFETHGEKLFESLSGSFNVLIWYPDQYILKVINSKLGLYPLYYSFRNGSLALSTRLGIFRDILKPVKINYAVLMQHCLYNYPVSAQTFLEGIFLLPSASVLILKNDLISIQKYWSVTDVFTTGTNFKTLRQSTELLDDILDRKIMKICSGNTNLALSLTGGWDGRLLLSYALKYVAPEQILLYSHGTLDNPDVKLPMATAKKMNYKYVPVLLSNREYEKDQLQWAGDTVKYSDGLRQISRLHYLYNMHLLNKEYRVQQVISGIGGSNLLKSTNYKPCDVFNRFVIELIESDNLDHTLKGHYDYCMQNNSALFNQIDFEAFKSSFDIEMFRDLHSIKNKNKRFITFLIAEIERRYFGTELQSYKHLIKNYSPFFDDDFISALGMTIFFDSNSDKGLAKSHHISMLYAKLTTRNNITLAKEPTDRGFSMYEVANPLLFPKMLLKYFRHKLVKAKDVNYFNQKSILQSYTNRYFPDIVFHADGNSLNNLFMENYVSAISFIVE